MPQVLPAASIRRLPNTLLSQDEMIHLYECYNLQLLVDASKKIMLGLLIHQGVTVEELKRLSVKDIYLKEGKVFISGSSHSNERWLRLEAAQVLEETLLLSFWVDDGGD